MSDKQVLRQPSTSHPEPVIVTLCEVCEKPTVEPIYHAEEGDTYCGSCVASLLGAEVDLLRKALQDIAKEANEGGVFTDGPVADSMRRCAHVVSMAHAALALREEQS